FFFFISPPPTTISTLSLHDALPISLRRPPYGSLPRAGERRGRYRRVSTRRLFSVLLRRHLRGRVWIRWAILVPRDSHQPRSGKRARGVHGGRYRSWRSDLPGR